MIFIFIAGVAGNIYSYKIDDFYIKIGVNVISTALLLSSAGVIFGLLYIQHFIKGRTANGEGLNLEKTFSTNIVVKLLSFLKRTPLTVVITMLKARFNSVLTLTNDVFLKRIRQLLYVQFMDEGRKSFRVKTNHIYDLAFSNDLNRKNNDGNLYQPSRDMQVVAQCAFEMGTTLWFDNENKDHNQAALIACGQFTTCYNLLIYVARLKDPSYFYKLPEAEKEAIIHLEQKLNDDYTSFKSDPFGMYNIIGKKFKIDNFISAIMTSYPFPKEFDGLR